jgi:2-C-methyl-D-erythritol 2,4-cyclodiphosphate synthase
VLLHAIGDAILGALGLGDLGRHFPDTDPRYKDFSSVALLEQIHVLAEQKGFVCANIDATIVAQEPKLVPYADAMAENICRCLKIDKAAVNIKAKTTEGLGFEGRGEGMSAYAVVLMKQR